jgi:F0F1-type ATP synthase assembly protein I
MFMSSTNERANKMSHDTDRAKVDAKSKTEKATRRHKAVAIAEGIIIGTAIVLALGFYLGDHYASNRAAQMQHAVKAASTQPLK